MSVTDIKNTFTKVVADGKINSAEVRELFTAPGAISADEEKAIKSGAVPVMDKFETDAGYLFSNLLGELPSLRAQATSANSEVARVAPALTAEVKAKLKAGAATQSYGGTVIPEAVKTVVRDALAKGAVAYDVREVKPDPVFDTSHGEGELIVEGKYNPYSQEQQAGDSMAFSYTELTPKKIEADMNTVQDLKILSGYEPGENGDAKFVNQKLKGNGRITELYDESSWPETFARAPGGQKYASNFAILADGSVHCVPASRRTALEPNRILTTASLGRGKQMLFNGHLHMEAGVVTYVGLSGRLCKMQAKKEASFVDAVALLKAWGFKTAPGLTVTNEG